MSEIAQSLGTEAAVIHDYLYELLQKEAMRGESDNEKTMR